MDVLAILMLLAVSAQLWRTTDSVERCKWYPNPKHGRMVCDSLFRLFCVPECDDGFVFESKPAVVYMCGPLTGEWFTYPEGQTVPWPNCVREKGLEDTSKSDLTTRRAQISAKIHQTYQGIFPNNLQMQPVQTGQQDARYIHMFDYIQRAQQIYSDKGAFSTLGLKAPDEQKQLQLKLQQQQRQKQLARVEQLGQKEKDMQPQLSSQRVFMQMQKLRHRLDQSSSEEMVDKQRQQREAFELLDTNNYKQQDMGAMRFLPGRITTNQNLQERFQSSAAIGSKTMLPNRGTLVSVLYPKMPQKFYQRHSSDRTIPTNTKVTTMATGELNQQKINPIMETYSPKGLALTSSISSALNKEVSERSRTKLAGIMPRLASTQTDLSPPWQHSEFYRSSNNLDQNLTHQTLQPVKAKQRNIHSLLSNEITSPEADMKPFSQSKDSIRVQMESPVVAPFGNSGLSKVSSNSNQNVQGDALQPVKARSENTNSPGTNETRSLGIGANIINQSRDGVLAHTSSPFYAPCQKESNLLSLQKPEGPVQPLSVKPTAFTLQAKNISPLGIQSGNPLNITSQIPKQGYLKDEINGNPHVKTAKKEKLFYFPIKRDTLISLLPMHLQAKYRSLRDTRNLNSTQKVSPSRSNVNSTVKMEGITSPNILLKNDFHISRYKYSVEQVKTGNESITEYFYLPARVTAKVTRATSVNRSVNNDSLLERDSSESNNETKADS